jgi:serine/threonine protein kinase
MNGRVIASRYELSSIIGQGGMGQVWTAYDQRLDRRVAVKLLRPDRMAAATGADEMRRRFVRECRVTAQVDHPGLVTVHDAGSDDDDLFLVMQYVEGADLADHLAEHDPYPWPWAVSVAAQLCAVLAAVHAVPIVHRDLKPRNVMVKPDGTLTVLDLGVASVIDMDTTRLTHTGSPIGSPAYMAPEQAMGGAVGPYTDIYALGVLLHELLSGNVPFAGSTALGVLHRHLYEAPARLRGFRPEIPEQLEELVLRMLAKDPQDRPAGAQEVYGQLAPLLPARGGDAGPLDPTRPFRRPHAPWPDRATSPASVPRMPQHAPDPGHDTRNPYAAPTAPGTPGARTTHSTPGSQATPPGLHAEQTQHTPVPAANSTDVAGAVDEVKRLLGEGSITQAVDILGSLLPTAAREHGERSPVVRILRKQYASTLMDDGQYRRALPELRRLADDRAAEAGPGDTQTLEFRYDAALCLEQLGDAAAAVAEYRAVLPYYENPQWPGADRSRAFDIRHRIGHLLLAMGDHAAAHQQLQALLYDTELVYGPYHPLPVELRRGLERRRQFRGA